MIHLKKVCARALPATFIVLAAHGALAQEITPEPPDQGEAEEHVDLATKWKVDDADPMASIPSVEDRNKDPLEFGYYLQDMLLRAEGAYRKQDFAKAIKYYKPLSVAVPTVARSHSRLCDSYARQGEMVSAIESCRTAITLTGAKVIDHLRYVDLLLRKPSFGPTDAQDVTASLEHLREYASRNPQPLPGQQPAAAAVPAPTPDPKAGWNLPPSLAPDETDKAEEKSLTPEEKAAAIAAEQENMKRKMRELLEGKVEPEPVVLGGPHLPTQIEFATCRLAVRTGEIARLPECMSRLREYKMPEKALLPFAWAQALQQRDEMRSGALLGDVKKSGGSPEVLAAMQLEHEKVFGVPWMTQLKRQWPPLLGLTALLLSGLLFFGKRRSARLAPATRSDAAI